MKTGKIRAFVVVATLFYLAPTANARSNWELFAKQCTEGQGQPALDACNQALSLMPNGLLPNEYVKVYISKGVSLGELDRHEEALRSFKKAIKFDPQNAMAYYNMGLALDNLGCWHKGQALRAYRKSTKLDGGTAETWGNLGLVAFDVGRYEEAIKAFETAQKIEPLYFTNRAEQEETYKEAVNIKPATVSHGREISFKLIPNLGYLGKIEKNVFKQFLFVLPEFSTDIQIYKNWFATGSFLYSHTYGHTVDDTPTYDPTSDDIGGLDPNGDDINASGDLDIYGISFGIKYIQDYADYHSDASFLDKSRYWFAIAAGPYITDVSLGNVRARSVRGVSFGFNGGVGMDYYFHPNVAIGLQFKMHYVRFRASLPSDGGVNDFLNSYLINDYIIFDGGPAITGRF